MIRSPVLTLIAVTMLASPLAAQSSSDANSATRVRLTPVSSHAKKLVGDAVSIGADTIHIVLKGATDTIKVATASLRRIDEFQGRRSNFGRGALIGAITLGIAGAIITPTAIAAIGDGPSTNQLEAVGVGFAGGALAGALVGAAIGAMTSRERWSECRSLYVRVAPTSTGMELGVAAHLSF